jgi:hypothetical protein
MKSLFLLFCLCGSIFLLQGSEAQKMPEFRSPLLKKNLNILQNVEVVHFYETKEKKGIIARSQGIYKKVDLSKRSGSYGFVKEWERHRYFEYVFIEGLDHDTLTSRGKIYHRMIGVDQRGLWVWRTGIETVRFRQNKLEKEQRLKKYTVDPQVAQKYFEQKERRSFQKK